ncbi:hypothetical protein ETF27_08030 [Prevotella brunnea]|uniref:Uncharacterized protein n=1 Tax=Prevotella brunnea TaxID=2508867 RepID=A0A5C8GFS1_9BACT|nr:hypothetical protein [Prevotella brunnea]MDR0186056.1 hypothetical protein [Prevotella brunnea]TXJ60801.1 hypothetical protein ETF27_08030 [Prevotella brunnea]
MADEIQNSTASRPQHRTRIQKPQDRFLKIRQWLNSIFMLGAIVGVILYIMPQYERLGTIVILASMVFKFFEVILRLFR